jgi:uncharacterized protein (TIGR03437 family)
VIVAPPQAPPGHRAAVVALNSDGQSSLFLQNDNPPVYSYNGEGAQQPAFVLSPNTLPSGVEATVQIDAVGTQFVDGQVSVGFGSTDVTARRIWVVSPTRLMVNDSVSGLSAPAVLPVTIVSGLHIIQNQLAFAVSGPQQRNFWLSSAYLNAVTGQTSLNPGSQAMMLVGASPAQITATNTSVLLNDVRVPLVSATNGQIVFGIPATASPGPLTVRVETAGERSLPITIAIDPLPAASVRVLAASTSGGDAKPGELVFLSVVGLNGSASQALVTIAGRDARVMAVFPDGDRHTLAVRVPDETPRNTNVPVVVLLGDSTSEPFSLKIGG